MESETLMKLYRRIVVDFLDVLILLKLRNVSLSGYDIISYVHKRFNMLISSGTVYSCLYRLERDELIKGERGQRKRVYTLTQKGKKTIETLLNMKNKILGLIVDLFIG
ncbi:MAG: PadR family transcriptional regulator [Candidatus Bathyarchaeia archaeon]|nr:PadR family transcriptional regulator [Candidatus Bathyarchaeia archaeon]